MKYGFGIDLGGTTVKIAYFDETGTMLDKWEIPTVIANGGTQILPDIAASIAAYMAAHSIDASSILGLGIGVPGPVNAKGVVNKCINLGWGVFNIAEELTRLTGFPVKAGNDANVAALGEFWISVWTVQIDDTILIRFFAKHCQGFGFIGGIFARYCPCCTSAGIEFFIVYPDEQTEFMRIPDKRTTLLHAFV